MRVKEATEISSWYFARRIVVKNKNIFIKQAFSDIFRKTKGTSTAIKGPVLELFLSGINVISEWVSNEFGNCNINTQSKNVTCYGKRNGKC